MLHEARLRAIRSYHVRHIDDSVRSYHIDELLVYIDEIHALCRKTGVLIRVADGLVRPSDDVYYCTSEPPAERIVNVPAGKLTRDHDHWYTTPEAAHKAKHPDVVCCRGLGEQGGA